MTHSPHGASKFSTKALIEITERNTLWLDIVGRNYHDKHTNFHIATLKQQKSIPNNLL